MSVALIIGIGGSYRPDRPMRPGTFALAAVFPVFTGMSASLAELHDGVDFGESEIDVIFVVHW